MYSPKVHLAEKKLLFIQNRLSSFSGYLKRQQPEMSFQLNLSDGYLRSNDYFKHSYHSGTGLSLEVSFRRSSCNLCLQNQPAGEGVNTFVIVAAV